MSAVDYCRNCGHPSGDHASSRSHSLSLNALLHKSGVCLIPDCGCRRFDHESLDAIRDLIAQERSAA